MLCLFVECEQFQVLNPRNEEIQSAISALRCYGGDASLAKDRRCLSEEADITQRTITARLDDLADGRNWNWLSLSAVNKQRWKAKSARALARAVGGGGLAAHHSCPLP